MFLVKCFALKVCFLPSFKKMFYNNYDNLLYNAITLYVFKFSIIITILEMLLP